MRVALGSDHGGFELKQEIIKYLEEKQIAYKAVALGPDGLPVRSAHGGYDLRGVQAAARQHGGTMIVKWENSWFTVRILLPIPEKE